MRASCRLCTPSHECIRCFGGRYVLRAVRWTRRARVTAQVLAACVAWRAEGIPAEELLARARERQLAIEQTMSPLPSSRRLPGRPRPARRRPRKGWRLPGRSRSVRGRVADPDTYDLRADGIAER